MSVEADLFVGTGAELLTLQKIQMRDSFFFTKI